MNHVVTESADDTAEYLHFFNITRIMVYRVTGSNQ